MPASVSSDRLSRPATFSSRGLRAEQAVALGRQARAEGLRADAHERRDGPRLQVERVAGPADRLAASPHARPSARIMGGSIASSPENASRIARNARASLGVMDTVAGVVFVIGVSLRNGTFSTPTILHWGPLPCQPTHQFNKHSRPNRYEAMQ